MVRLRVSATSLVLLVVLGATARAVAPTGDSRSKASATEALLGSWHLVWLKTSGPDGVVRPVDCSGRLVFTREGTMAVQVMYANESAGDEGGGVRYAVGGYEASYGRYAVASGTHTFTYHVDGALVRSLIGKDLPRSYEIAGRRLIIRSTNPAEHWEVGWERDQDIRP
jgi:Lipocalin-like domain